MLDVQKTRAENKKKRGTLFLFLFYILEISYGAYDLSKAIDDGESALLVGGIAVGLVAATFLTISYIFIRSPKYVLITTYLYALLVGTFHVMSGCNGYIGLFGGIFGYVMIFEFLETKWAAVLSYIRCAITFVVFIEAVRMPGSHLYAYELRTRAIYFLIIVTVTIACHWFGSEIDRIADYRDESLSLAVSYMGELEEARDEAIRANRSKSEFLSNMSHDIRTPMNAILGYTMILKKHVTDTEMVENTLDKIEVASNHLNELINDVLTMSKIEAGEDTLKEDIIDLYQLENDIQTIIRPIANEKSIQIIGDFPEFQHPYVIADESKARRIIINIMNNAVKYTDEGGQIRCWFAETVSNPDEKTSTFEFIVEDNGIGMSQEYLTHIFDTFSRENQTTSRNTQGTGLGMAITKQYVDLMQGQIQIDSELGVGTKVTVTVQHPWAEPETHETIENSVSEESFAGKRFLVVDDSEINREITCEMLQDVGILTDSACDGREAVDKLLAAEDGAYDYVLMDVRMPVLNGMDATREIRRSDRQYLRNLPIIALTANAFDEDVRDCLDAGMSAHLSKPFYVEDLLILCSRYLPENL